MSDVFVSREGHVGIAEIQRAPNNFFDKALIRDIASAFEAFDAQSDIRSILLCSDGRHFCAGANFGGSEAEVAENFRGEHIYRHAVRLFRCETPIVAAVQGGAIGGGLGLALAADFRVASAESRFAANFSTLGIHPGFGVSVTLPRVVGAQRAALMMCTGRRIGGAEATRIGLVDELAPQDGIRAAALRLATEIAQNAPLALVSLRRTLRCGLADEVAAIVEHELGEQLRHFETEDFREGVRATAERRAPVFSGR